MTATEIIRENDGYVTRTTTLAELVADTAWAVEHGRRVGFKHPTVEQYALRGSKCIVSHKQRGTSKITMIDGVPHVTFRGKHRPISGLAMVSKETGKVTVFQYTIDTIY